MNRFRALRAAYCLVFAALTSCGNHALLSDRVATKPSPRDGGSKSEKEMAALIRGHSGQTRTRVDWDSRLAKSARNRARDMGRRGYFNHVDPDGYRPNWYVTRTGYQLPL